MSNTAIDPKSTAHIVLKDALPQTLRHIFGQAGVQFRYSTKRSARGEIIIDDIQILELLISEARQPEQIALAIWAALKNKFKGSLTENGGFLSPASPGSTWQEAWDHLKLTTNKRALETAVKAEAKKWINNLLIPLRDPQKKSRKRKVVGGTPDQGRSANFSKEVLKRDNYTCVVSGVIHNRKEADKVAEQAKNYVARANLEVAHIMPHHLSGNDGKVFLTYLERFWSGGFTTAHFKDLVDKVCNGLPLVKDCHGTFDQLHWSIEAKSGSYTLHYTRKGDRAPDWGHSAGPHAKNGMKLIFGTGDPSLEKPNASFCNLHYAICRVANQSGMAEVFDDEFKDADRELRESYAVPDSLATGGTAKGQLPYNPRGGGVTAGWA